MKEFNYGLNLIKIKSKQKFNNILQSQKKAIGTMIELKQKNVLKLCLKLRRYYSGNCKIIMLRSCVYQMS